MADRDSSLDILGSILGIIGGVGMLALAARKTKASRRAGPRIDDRPGPKSLNDIMRSRPQRRRKPPEAGQPVPAIPPRGPAPLQGGAAAALDAAGD
jgi:hypothetical protein